MNPTLLHKPTVFVVDDDQQMRESLVALLTAMRFPAKGFCSAGEFRAYYERSMPGCLLLDIKMPEQDGLELYEQLLRENKRIPVVFITAHADVTTAVACMKTGAIEFLEKPFDRQGLLEHVERALALDATWRAREADYQAHDQRMRRLTPRERDTLELILTGDSNKVMASKLQISERAVEMRRVAIMQKMQTRSLAELVERAIVHRILGDIQGARRNSWMHI